MIKFNPENKEVLTYGEALKPCAEIKNKEDAQQYLKEYVKFIQDYMDKNPDEHHDFTALEIAKQNIGYYAGYYDYETRSRIEELFDCSHPLFGKAKLTVEDLEG